MRIMKRLLLSAIAAVGLAGCYTTGTVGTGYSYGYASAGYAAPDMYYLSDGVNVVAYADYPTFYSDGYYWQYNNGLWYSSNYYGGGWAVNYNVPYRVRTINNPYGYTRFQGGRGWTRVSGNGTYRGNGNYGSYNPRGYDARGGASNPPAGAYSAPRGGRPNSSYQPTYRARSTGGGSYSPPRGNGPTVRDHRRR